MLSNPRDLSVWYPLMPPSSGALPTDLEASILSACIYATLAPRPLDDINEAGNRSLFTATLSSLSVVSDDASCTASITVAFPFLGSSATSQLTVRLVFGSSSATPYGAGYVLMRSKPAVGTYSIGRQLHPDCVVVMQQAPYAVLYSRSSVLSCDGINGKDGAQGASTIIQSGSMALDDGHNAEVSWDDGTLTITGAAGAGQGVYTTPPYTDVSTPYASAVHKGLKTLNGAGPDVIVTYGGTFEESTLKGISHNVPCHADITVIPVLADDYVLS